MTEQDRLDDLLDRWEEARERGTELLASEFCKDCPDLHDRLTATIDALKRTDWMFESDDELECDYLPLPPMDSLSDPALVPASVTLDQFAKSIVTSGVMTDDELSLYDASSAQELAVRLLRSNQLTRYQLKLLAGGNTKGLVLGNYVVLDKIGAGGMGKVFRARHRRMDRIVALKVLPAESVESPAAIERFHQEVKAAAKLEHANIVTSFDADESDKTHFLVMQYIDGQDLASIVRRRGPMSVRQAVDCVTQAAKGLEYAHSVGIVHRDIKPANLLLDKKGTIKILDMGLARIEKGSGVSAVGKSQLTQDGSVMGTIDFMSPEQAMDTHCADARSDIYSLGCTLFFLLTGKPVYGGARTLLAKMMAHKETAIPMLSEARKGVPSDLSAVFAKMVAKQPGNRFQSATALLEALGNLSDGLGDDQMDAAASQESIFDLQSKETSSASFDETLDLQSAQNPGAKGTASSANNAEWYRVIGGTVAALALAFFCWALFTVTFRVETPEGTVVVEPNVTDVDIFVDDQKAVYITDPDDKGRITVKVPKGAKMMRVTKDGFEADVSSFNLNSRTGPIKVTFVPKSERSQNAQGRTAKIAPTATTVESELPIAVVPFNAEQAVNYQQAWADYLGIDVETTNSIGITMRLIPPGEFLMGNDNGYLTEDQRRNSMPHKVTITQPFQMSAHEITRGQFRRFVEESGYKAWAENDRAGEQGSVGEKSLQTERDADLDFKQTDEHPVVIVSWHDAQSFCSWLSDKEGVVYRLPTEAEWEYACRAGSPGPYCFASDAAILDEYAWFGSLGGGGTKPIGQRKANSFGLFDMHGNVWEWCQDWHHAYSKSEAVDPVGPPTGFNRVLRGGSYLNSPENLQSSHRFAYQPHKRIHDFGFRIVKTVR